MKVDGWFSREDAIRVIDESHERWREQQPTIDGHALERG